ncbi:hypothetical protein BD311DRAFT_807154 [Dichomitus squalens]|uniref:Uncharacterized protein n=1 Tax=Dichomitus squalens TaxID=114155 RepID=A0A4Q9MPW1_9APHY|nr:hypothetical protein BD311DRAFT_807154 [Dichomitus squalens]
MPVQRTCISRATPSSRLSRSRPLSLLSPELLPSPPPPHSHNLDLLIIFPPVSLSLAALTRYTPKWLRKLTGPPPGSAQDNSGSWLWGWAWASEGSVSVDN